jgi:hypothetical protein
LLEIATVPTIAKIREIIIGLHPFKLNFLDIPLQ